MNDISGRKFNIGALVKSNLRNYSMFIILIVIMLVFGPLCNWTNFKGRNITYIFFQFSYVFILATGMVQCIIIGGIDLSVGSICAFIGALSAYIYNTGVGLFVTILAALVMGFILGAFQGWFIAYPKIPPFIVTLAGMLLFRGLTYIVTNVNPVNPIDDVYSYLATGTVDEDLLHMEEPNFFGHYPASFVLALIILVILWLLEFRNRKAKLANGSDVTPPAFFIGKLVLISALVIALAERFAEYRGLPIVVIVLLVTVGIFHFVLKNTVLGRYIYAVGGNARSAKLSGINTEFVTFIVFCFMGTLTGLAAVVTTGYMNSALPQAGNMFEMDAIAACYIGGVSASGGIGTVIGVVVGGLVMAAINNGMTLMNLGAHYQYVVKALVVLLAVFYDVYSRRKAGLG
ncbi:MAG: sugar ABC transporter permease [Spirochaetaceae bacterium]|jgi:putative multiple sugar transport system permease protein|nr:sugar ABC transporter permease [Spirochaetaceae bacterium]